MGMDLKPVRPTKKAPRYPKDYHYAPQRGKVIWGRYNWAGWRCICEHLHQWGVLTKEFDGMNDGKLISAKTCRAVADAIEKHLPELPPDEQEWLKDDIELWRTCGGYRQW